MAITLTAEVETALTTLKEGLKEIYGPRLKKLILYGSQARGGARPDSDIDVAIVLAVPSRSGMRLRVPATFASASTSIPNNW